MNNSKVETPGHDLVVKKLRSNATKRQTVVHLGDTDNSRYTSTRL